MIEPMERPRLLESAPQAPEELPWRLAHAPQESRAAPERADPALARRALTGPVQAAQLAQKPEAPVPMLKKSAVAVKKSAVELEQIEHAPEKPARAHVRLAHELGDPALTTAQVRLALEPAEPALADA